MDCRFCGNQPMQPKVTIPVADQKPIVIYQCPMCQRINQEQEEASA